MTRHRMALHENDQGASDGPVTIIVTRKAKKGKINEFEEWMDGIIHEAMKFEGHMGVNVIRPPDPSNPEYVIIFRFNTYENLAKWEKSEVRKEWLRKSTSVIEGDQVVQMQTGLEFWFTPRSGSSGVPPRYKMAIVTGGIIYVMLNTLIPIIRELTVNLPLLLSTFAVVAVMVPLMTYVIMPPVTRLLRSWLLKPKMF